ncbi:CPBP family intramembrane metalloprotease [Xanthomonas arboricola pv. juglandis]|uniref:CPBP family intramembrane glutamic endopeptidase n=1 Tax=Xanthomonas TaxID=338 RepID=UPI000E5B307E|nr:MULTISPECIES: CPBP family intramembrane glutamic endopeptidase [Xanthomonas]CAD1785682.1 CPBP family intramembrane metalloprotease [Xanthomonas sp. CPBF 426]CAG2081947.1 CPBP family intramembrane metalloprotease [Xanthomonas euroxanthea]SYZ49779.1 CPBP family intramembrane metalloprotease [Xanthomonas arboricola pv. juglandis]
MLTDPPPRPAARPVAGNAPLLPPLLGFGIDVLIATGLLLLLSVAGFALWGVFRGVSAVQAAKAQGLTPSPTQIMATIGQPGVLVQLLTALVSTASPALLLYYWRRRATADERRASRAATRRASTWGWTALIAVGVFLLSNLVSVAASALGIKPVPTNLPLMEEAIKQWPLALVVFAVAIAPAYEELLFRRVLFGRLLAAGRPWLGIVLSSAIFALVHEVPGVSGNGPAAIAQLWLVYGSMGAAFAWLYWRTGTLWAPIVAHGVNNATALAALYFFGLG